MNTQAAEKVVFDFSDETKRGEWQVVNDDVMGGISRSNVQLTNSLAVFRGDVSLENNGGFASVRSAPSVHHLDGSAALLVRVRGDGRRYKLTVRTDRNFDGVVYQAAFDTKPGTWEEHRVKLKDFVPTFRGRVLADEPMLDAARIRSIGFLISDKQEGPFRLEVAWIKAVSDS